MYYVTVKAEIEDDRTAMFSEVDWCFDITMVFAFREDGDNTLVMMDTANEMGNFIVKMNLDKFRLFYNKHISEFKKQVM